MVVHYIRCIWGLLLGWFVKGTIPWAMGTTIFPMELSQPMAWSPAFLGPFGGIFRGILGPTEGRNYEQKTTENMGGNWKDQTKKYPKPIQRWNPPILESFSLILLDIELKQKGKLIEFLCLSSIFRASIKCLFCHNCFALSHFFGWWFDCLWAMLGHATTTHEKAFLGMTDLFHASTISPFLKRGEEGM